MVPLCIRINFPRSFPCQCPCSHAAEKDNNSDVGHRWVENTPILDFYIASCEKKEHREEMVRERLHLFFPFRIREYLWHAHGR